MAASIVTLQETKAQLNITSDASDVELGNYLAAATDMVAQFIGPTEPTSFVEVCHPAHQILLAQTPVVSIASVTGVYTDTVYDPSGWVIDKPAGVVYVKRSGLWGWPCEPVQVTYTAGWSPVPGAAKLAALVIIQHLWETQRASPLAAGPLDSSTELHMARVPGPVLPEKARGLLAPFRRAPAVA